jgi:hypothetical protein
MMREGVNRSLKRVTQPESENQDITQPVLHVYSGRGRERGKSSLMQ